MRGWGQTVIWDLAAPTLWRLQQQLGEVKWVAVRDSGCIHAPAARVLRARADPRDMRRSDARRTTARRSGCRTACPRRCARRRGRVPPPVQPARGARVGRARRRRVPAVRHRVAAVAGARRRHVRLRRRQRDRRRARRAIARVPHFDTQHHARRYHALAHKLEDEARDWFTTRPARRDRREVRGGRGDRARDTRPTAYPVGRARWRGSSRRSRAATTCACAARCASGSIAAARRRERRSDGDQRQRSGRSDAM